MTDTPASTDAIRVLHVDDDPEFADLTATYLEREDERFEVETAASADAGLARLEEGESPPDCVVSDYNMPGMDGIDFLAAVRESHPDLPFVLFTGKGSESVASEAISAGVTDYLRKRPGPEGYELLANRISNAVEARRDARRARRQEELMRLTEFAGDTGGWELDLASGKLLLTDGARRLLGLDSEAELSLAEALRLLSPDDRPEARAALDRAVGTGEEAGGTWWFRTVDGDERLADVTIIPVESDGDVTTLRGAVHDITERRARERELREERRFVEQAVNALDDLFYVVDTDGEIRRWNDRVPEVTGYDEATLGEMRAVEVFAADHRTRVLDGLDEALTTGQATVQADVVTAAGDHIPYEFTGARLTDTEGAVTGIVGIGRDLSERRARERRFQAFVEQSTDLISVVDADGRFQYQSPSIEHVLGYDPRETLGDSAFEYIHPDDRERIVAQFERALDEPDATPVMEYRARHADGSWRWMEARGNNQLANPAIEGYVINSRDVTERKRRERELERRNDRLEAEVERRKAAETRYRSLFENSPVVIWEEDFSAAKRYVDELAAATDDLEARLAARPEELDRILELVEVVDVNENALSYYGAESKAELIGSLDRLLTAESRATNREMWARIAAGDTEFRAETASRTLDGERRDELLELYVPEPYADDYSRAYVTVTDITERTERERELERQNERLDEFASVVSHDLRNPLAVADGYIELAREGGDDDPDHLDTAAAAVDRARQLVDDLLALARGDETAGGTTALPLADVVDDCWRIVETGEATLDVALDTDLVVEANRSRLRQLLENLIRNAVERSGGTVTVGALDDDRGPGFYVADDGPGVPDERRSTVFESGYSTAADGTGLGLAIVRDVVEAHGWAISVTDSEDGGARFEIETGDGAETGAEAGDGTEAGAGTGDVDGD